MDFPKELYKVAPERIRYIAKQVSVGGFEIQFIPCLKITKDLQHNHQRDARGWTKQRAKRFRTEMPKSKLFGSPALLSVSERKPDLIRELLNWLKLPDPIPRIQTLARAKNLNPICINQYTRCLRCDHLNRAIELDEVLTIYRTRKTGSSVV